MKSDVVRTAAEVVISLIAFGVLIPVLFGGISISLDRYFGLGPLFSEQIGLILTAGALVVGLFWVLWSYSYLLFVGYGSPVEAFGRALSPTKQLVTVGPYAYTRNPMVLGYLWILLAVVLYMRSLSGIVLIPIITLLAVAYLELFEEPALERRFGEKYKHYREHVPVLIPSWRVYIKPESAVEA